MAWLVVVTRALALIAVVVPMLTMLPVEWEQAYLDDVGSMGFLGFLTVLQPMIVPVVFVSLAVSQGVGGMAAGGCHTHYGFGCGAMICLTSKRSNQHSDLFLAV